MTLTVAFWASSSAGVLGLAEGATGEWMSLRIELACEQLAEPSVGLLHARTACSQMYETIRNASTRVRIAHALHQRNLAGVEELLDAGHDRLRPIVALSWQDALSAGIPIVGLACR